jgi:hypothetical protein
MKVFNETVLLALLVLLTITIFLRTMIYIILDENMFALNKKIDIDENSVVGMLSIIDIIRFYLVVIILVKKEFKYNLLDGALVYILFNSFVRLYYKYLYYFEKGSLRLPHLVVFQNVNNVLEFFASLVILYKIFVV